MTSKNIMTDEQAFNRISHLQNQAITLIRERGQWEQFGETPVMGIKNHGNLSILYMTPFQRPRNATEIKDYALEIRAPRQVVLSLVWKNARQLFVETYRPGAWEAALEEPNVTSRLAA